MNADVQSITSTIVVTSSILLNVLFIYVICKKGQKSMGSYRHLMVCFAICNMLYSSLEFADKPTVYIYGHSIMVYFKGYLGSVQWLEACVGYTFFSMMGIHTALLVLHFLYRYILVCKPHKRIYFEGFNLLLWAIPVLFWGLLHIFVVVYCYKPNSEYYDYAAKAVQNSLHRDLNDMIFYCVFIYAVVDGKFQFYWRPTLGLSMVLFMMFTTFTVMLFYGVKIVGALQEKGLSKKTIELQKQLLRALAVQAFIPFILTYIPRALTLLLPIMGVSLPSIFKFVPLVLTVSMTVFDPIAIMLCISDYRRTVLRLFRKQPIPSSVVVKVTTVTSPTQRSPTRVERSTNLRR